MSTPPSSQGLLWPVPGCTSVYCMTQLVTCRGWRLRDVTTYDDTCESVLYIPQNVPIPPDVMVEGSVTLLVFVSAHRDILGRTVTVSFVGVFLFKTVHAHIYTTSFISAVRDIVPAWAHKERFINVIHNLQTY